jgi:hypothetical protein
MNILQVLGTDKAIRINGYNVLGLVNSFEWAPNFNAQDIMELGNTSKVDTAKELDTQGTIELSETGNLAGLLARMKPKFAAGDFDGFVYDPTYVSGNPSGKNSYTFDQDDLANLRFDLIQHEKTDQVNFNRSVYLPCAYLTRFGGRVDANGMGNVTFNWAGQYVAGFVDPFHDIVSVPGSVATSLTIDLSATPVSSSTHSLAYVIIDGRTINSAALSATNRTQAGLSGSTVTLTTNEGYTIPDGAIVTVCAYVTTSTTTWADLFTPDRNGSPGIFYVKGWQANVYLAPADANGPLAPELWLKAQTMDWNVDMKVETLRQIALNVQASSIYARVPTYPLDVTANVTVTESDWADWKAIMTGKSFSGGAVADNTFEFSPAFLKPSFAVVVDYFTKTGTKVQTMQMLDMRPDSYGTRVNVGGRGEVTWGLKGTQWKVIGIEI